MTTPAATWPHGPALLDDIRSARPAHGSLALWHVGQSGWVVKGGATVLLFDPFLSPSAGRVQRTWEPPLTPEEVGSLSPDLVFCTHDHLDHLDPFTVSGIARASSGTRIVVPEGAMAHLREIGVGAAQTVQAVVDEEATVGPVQVRAVPASHGDRADPIAEAIWERDPERGYRFVGYVVDVNGVRLYHAGDTVIYPGMVNRLAPLGIDVALLPINGRDWFREQQGIIGNTDHREAADLGQAIGARVIVPMHYDMFAGNPGFPGWFVDYCQSQYPGQDLHVPVRCRRWTYVRSQA